MLTRNEKIASILSAARLPCPGIAEIGELLGSDGKWRGPFSFPRGVTFAGERRTAGYAYRGKDGRTHGTRSKTAGELRSRWEAGQDRAADDFRSHLDALTDARIDEQFTFWAPRASAVRS